MTQTVPTPTRAVQQRYRDPEPVEPAQWNPVLQVLHEHCSVRRYLADPVPDGTLRLLISAAQSAPTSSNLQVWSVIAVRDPQRKARLAALAGNQAHILHAPVLLPTISTRSANMSPSTRAESRNSMPSNNSRIPGPSAC